ncbi:MAG: DUF4430 domain-containing protein, partial [Lachnospiraceae bacterium]|nr:DUF4430 domain-containing protein [Lachnospiraceae bacterium]
METKKNNKGLIIGIVALVAVIAILLCVFLLNRPATSKGAKSVTIDVVSKDGSDKSYKVQTDAEYLRQAMDEAQGLTYSGTDSDYGMMVE